MSILHLRWASAILAVFNRSLSSSLVIQHNHAPTNETFIQEVVNCQSSVLLPMVEFVATNYIAHAFTIRFSPGYGIIYSSTLSILALVFPYFGLLMTCRSMEQLAKFTDDPLDAALKAGALCTVARTKSWKPEPGDKLRIL
jgi:hypothetical protein